MTIDLTFLQTHGEMVLAMIAVIFVMALFWAWRGWQTETREDRWKTATGRFFSL